MRSALIVLALLMAGCDVDVEKIYARMTGHEIHRVILSAQPVTIRETPMTLTSPEPMKVVGEWTALCLVLKDGVPIQPSSQMDQIFSSAMGSAKVKTVLTMGDGSRITLHEPMQGWARSGRVLPHDELSACASAACGTRLPIGGIVKSVELSAAPQLQVRGIYWESQQGPNEGPPPEQSKVASSAGQSRCGAS
jgi:hypothetical protein